MCEYCGCQEIPAIAALTAEHDEIRAVSQAARTGDEAEAVRQCVRLVSLLRPHTAIEERGLFPAMATEFTEHVASLCGDHRRIEKALAEVAAGPPLAPGWQSGLGKALGELTEHILREQDGLFPASLSVLTPEQWDELDRVRTQVVEPSSQIVINAIRSS